MTSPERRGPSGALDPGEVHVWSFRLSAPLSDLRRLEKGLSPSENARLARRLRREDRDRLAVAWGTAREILAGYVGCGPADVRVRRGPTGKPIVVDPRRAVEFSLSHCGEFSVVAVTSGNPAGVDVERMRHGVRIDDLIRRFFSEREIEGLLSLPLEDREAAFFRVWVRKEAYLKAVGGGVPAGLARFSVSVAPDEPPAILDTELEPGGVSAFSLYDIDVPEGYVSALAVEGTGHRIRYMSR